MRSAARWSLALLGVAVAVLGGPVQAQEDPAQKEHLAESIVAQREAAAERAFEAEERRRLIEALAARPLAELEALVADPLREIEPKALGDANRDLLYTPVVPCRIVDTRVAGGPLVPDETRDFKVVGGAHQAQGGSIVGCGVPTGPTSAVLNIVAVNATGPGHLRAWAYSTPPVGPPLAAVLTFGAGLNISNGIPVPICDPSVTTCPFDVRIYAAGAPVHVVIDVVGYFGRFPGGPTPAGTGFRHVTGGAEDAAAKLVDNADVAPGAAIAESKLALNFPTHSTANDPSAAEKAALAGTSGTPNGTNRYVTNADPRNSDARVPLVHGDGLHDATVASLSSGLVPSAELGSGPASATTFLRGDRTWTASPKTLVAFAETAGTVAIQGTCTHYTGSSVTINAPSAGTVVVHADTTLLIDHTNGTDSYFAFFIGTTPTDCSGPRAEHRLPSALPTGNSYEAVVGSSRAFTVSASGAQTYYLVGIKFSGGGNDVFWYGQITATFYPD